VHSRATRIPDAVQRSTALHNRPFSSVIPAVFRGHEILADHNEHKIRRTAAAFNELKTA